MRKHCFIGVNIGWQMLGTMKCSCILICDGVIALGVCFGFVVVVV